MKQMSPFCLNLLMGAFCLQLTGSFSLWPKPGSKLAIVEANIKTDDAIGHGDAADDACLYVNKASPRNSLVIGSDKKYGLNVFNLDGKRIQAFPDGRINNVDLRQDIPLGRTKIALISASNRSTNTIDFYMIDEKRGMVERLAVGDHRAEIEVYGSCMYLSPVSQRLYVFINSKTGMVTQYQILLTNENKIALSKVRTLKLSSQVEGCVSDDELARFYIAEEEVGIWRFGAEPDDDTRAQLIDSTEDGYLTADVEGLAIYRQPNGNGYLLASNQGENAFNIYQRKTGAFLGKFRISYRGQMIEKTDGIEASSANLGLGFDKGMVIVQDGNEDQEKQSFKLVSWAFIVRSLASISSPDAMPLDEASMLSTTDS